ncbi:FAD-dependent oxidoreductase [Nocardioides cheoyonin]|uniref:FAD-dependent oxidoreductase n=1 Tax=Nocardioides cheoyonin TaxID=3156615 RepID=UPI0032B59A2F
MIPTSGLDPKRQTAQRRASPRKRPPPSKVLRIGATNVVSTAATPRVAIVGLGTMGSMTAWQLAKHGIPITGYERFSSPHDRSSHAGQGRFFRVAYHEGVEYIPALIRARKLWLELQEEAGQQILRECGFLTIGDLTSPWLTELMKGVAEHGLRHQILEGTDFTARFPGHKPLADNESGVIDELGGITYPEHAVRSALSLARDRGATLHTYTDVVAIEPHGTTVDITTADGTQTFDRVIVTTGAFGPPPGLTLSRPIRVDRLFHSWFHTNKPADYTFETFLPFMRQSAGLEDYEVGIAGGPSPDGEIVRAGATVPYYRGDVDPDALDRTVPLDYVRRMSEVLGEYLPGIDPNPTRSAVYMDGYTDDLRPVIDTVGETTLVLSGFSGHGFKFSPLVGALAASWAISGDAGPLRSAFVTSPDHHE